MSPASLTFQLFLKYWHSLIAWGKIQEQMDHSLIESYKSCVPQQDIILLVPCRFSETVLCFWDCRAYWKPKVREICINNRNVMFAEKQLSNFDLQLSIIDLMFNINCKIITRNSRKSHNKTWHCFHCDSDLLFYCVFCPAGGLREED